MVRTRSQFQARTIRLARRRLELSGWAAGENYVVILPAKDGTRGGSASQHPGPFIRRDLLVGLALQFFERAEDGAEHDLKQSGVLVIHLDMLFDHREKTR